MALGKIPFPHCSKFIDSIQYIGNSPDIVVPVESGVSLELCDFINHW